MATKSTRKAGIPKDGLTDQQIIFCHEYAKCLSPGEAYDRAGYKCSNRNTRDSGASKLLRNPKVKAYLGEVLGLSSVSVVNVITAIAFTPITEVIRWDGQELTVRQTDFWSERAKLAVRKVKSTTRTRYLAESGDSETTVEMEVEMYDRQVAIEKLAKLLKLYPRPGLNEVEWLNEGVKLGLIPKVITDLAIENVDGFKGQIREAFEGVLPERTAEEIDQTAAIEVIKAKALGLVAIDSDGVSAEVD